MGENMTPAEAAAMLTYANQVDARIQVTDPNVDVWAVGLAGTSVEHARWVIVGYYARAENGTVQGQSPITPAIIRKRARIESERAAVKRAALERGPDVQYERQVNAWRSRNPRDWDELFTAGRHEQWDAWRRRGETNQPCPCGCGQMPA